MNTPIKPRIDFAKPLEAEAIPVLKAAQAFEQQNAVFVPEQPDPQAEEEGEGERVVEAALRPKRSLWRKMVKLGLAVMGVSVDRKSVV